MPTVAAHNNIQTTDQEQVLDVRGSTSLEITISTAAVYLRFAHRFTNVTGGLGIPELHVPKLLSINNEDIDEVSVRSAATGRPASVTIIATRE